MSDLDIDKPSYNNEPLKNEALNAGAISTEQLLPSSWKQDRVLSQHYESLQLRLQQVLSEQCHPHFASWQQAIEAAPIPEHYQVELQDEVRLECATWTSKQDAQLKSSLSTLMPWRKGPYQVFNTHLDTEWRSDWKWQRILPHLAPLQGRRILDVGCGNGYHCWRMAGAGATEVLGIDPSFLFLAQFLFFKRYLRKQPVYFLPLTLEALPEKMPIFDSTFSMGVFYHRRSPMDHLRELLQTLRPGGQVILETLIIDGAEGEVLVPPGRYAQMRNVWFIPSVPTLLLWMRKCGFNNPRCVDINSTSLDEQRRSEWMQFHSLADFLDPTDPSRTVEGHPAPKRAVFLAEK